MLDLLQKLFIGHIHHWVQIEKQVFKQSGYYHSTRYTCKCDVCGKIKKYKVTP